MSLRLALLGSTGSIGCSTLKVVEQHPDRLQVTALAAHGHHLDRLRSQIARHRPAVVAVADAKAARELDRSLGGTTRVVAGNEGLLEVATHELVDLVVAGMVGAAGVMPLAAALEAGKDAAVANKEALVVAGRLLMELAHASGSRVLPVDSEHVALHQGLRSGKRSEVRRLTLTASGGPFLERPVESWSRITPEEAVRHPTWSMGAKISIDSATLMNKGLELIEASHLFAIEEEKLEVVIHPQSLVHSVVEFRDGSCIAQLSANDMTLPIQYALSYPERWSSELPPLELAEVGRLEFVPLDPGRFPAVGLARQALRLAESAPAVLNAANEVAVQAFLSGRIAFPQIVATVEEVLGLHQPSSLSSVEDALEWDRWGRRRASELIASSNGN